MKHKKLVIIIIILITIGAVAIILTNNKSQDFSDKYPEIILELERMYGKDGNFKIVGIKGGEIDRRDYKAYAYPDGNRPDVWLGKYFEDAFLLIMTDYLKEPFYARNSFAHLRCDFAEAYLEEKYPNKKLTDEGRAKIIFWQEGKEPILEESDFQD